MGAENKTEARRRFLVNAAYWAVIFGAVLLALKYLLNLLMPFLLAGFFAVAVRPLALFLSSDTRWKTLQDGERVAVHRKFRMSPAAASVFSVLLLFLTLAALLTILALRLSDGVSRLIAALPAFYSRTVLPVLTACLERLTALAGRVDGVVLELVQSAAPNVLSSLGTAVTNLSARALGWVSSMAGKLPGFLLNTVICLIATVFIAVDYDRIAAFVRRNLPDTARRLASDIKSSFAGIVRQFVKSYFILFCITAAELAVGLLLIGVERAVLIAVLIAVFDALPVLGSGMILLPWALVALTSGRLWQGLGLAALYGVVLIVRQVMEPRIVGRHVGLRPLVTLLCMFAGVRLLGLPGLLGLPIAAAILIDLNDRGLIHLLRRSEPETTHT